MLSSRGAWRCLAAPILAMFLAGCTVTANDGGRPTLVQPLKYAGIIATAAGSVLQTHDTTGAPATRPLERKAAPSIAWLGHSAFLIRLGGKVLLTDPMFSRKLGYHLPLLPKRLAAPPPGIDRLEVCRRSRALPGRLGRVPVIMLTAKGEEPDKVRGLGTGAGDYVTKAFNPHDLMARAQREKGRFRSFLLGCLKHYLDNEWQKGSAQRRGGHLSPVHLDALAAEERFRVEVAGMSTNDDTAFDQQWAQGVLEQAVSLLRSEQADAARFELLLPALTGTENRTTLIAATGMNDGALKVAIHRLRRRYRELLRQIVADTVESEADVDEELAYLVACLRR